MLFQTHCSGPITCCLLAFSLMAASGQALAATVLEGYVPEITTQKLSFGGKYYPLVQGASQSNAIKWPQGTECYVMTFPSYQVTCGTLAQVGYIDKAKILIENDKVMRVDLLELMQ